MGRKTSDCYPEAKSSVQSRCWSLVRGEQAIIPTKGAKYKVNRHVPSMPVTSVVPSYSFGESDPSATTDRSKPARKTVRRMVRLREDGTLGVLSHGRGRGSSGP